MNDTQVPLGEKRLPTSSPGVVVKRAKLRRRVRRLHRATWR